MEDMTPELLKAIEDDFQRLFSQNSIVKDIYAKIETGTATYAEANMFSQEVGDTLASVYKRNLSSEILPDGKMYFNIADRVITPTMTNNYELITDVAMQVQKTLNTAAGIGIKPIIPTLNQDRIRGIVNKVSGSDSYDKVAWVLDEPIKTFSQSIVDDSIKVNAEFHSKSGMRPVIKRKVAGDCCDWCKAVAGTYSYPDDVPKDVYRRHQRCRCTVDYVPGNGKVQNVHSKKWKIDQEVLDYRKQVGLKKEQNIVLQKGKNVTSQYEKERYPSQGKISFSDDYDKLVHKEEVDMAQWIHKHFGGDITLLNESTQDGEKMPDYLWKDKYWELKSTTTEKAANSAIRKAIKQIERNPGGIILNYNTDIDLQQTVDVIEKRMKGSKDGDIPVDVMIIKKGELVGIYRY